MDTLVAFLHDHLKVEGESLNEMMSNCLGHQFVGTIAHVNERWSDPNSPLTDRIERTAPATQGMTRALILPKA